VGLINDRNQDFPEAVKPLTLPPPPAAGPSLSP
jgi:hypothetical protein